MRIEDSDETLIPAEDSADAGDNLVKKLAPCSYREMTTRPFVFYCRHTAVRSPDNLVIGSMCAACTVYETHCAKPRPRSGEADPKSSPPWYQRAWNLTTSVASFVSDGMKTVTKEQYDERLAICAMCPERNNNSCTRCGCNLSLKAQGRAFECPLSKWPEIPKDSA